MNQEPEAEQGTIDLGGRLWISQRRLGRMAGVLRRRQPDLTVVIENVHDPHNISAVLRSCDAVGVDTVHLVYTQEERPQLSRISSASALKWLQVVDHPSIAACYAALRRQGCRIYATHLGEASLDLYDLDLAQPSALVFGNEQRGVSPEAVAAADATMVIPMMGMVQSLNISVACAVSLYEALRQRRLAGAYAAPKLGQGELDARLTRWLEREGRITP
ncbi:MAG TPA: RNA methyltransferase [Nitrolancea sp.]|nr:RNA methyltransferase [Nitrolancea sp.]